MGGTTTPWPGGQPPSEEAVFRRMAGEGLAPRAWGNGPGDTYGWHEHEYDKVLYCVSGSIVFHTADGDLPLGPGTRMELPAGTAHAATVGSSGVRCVEAPGRRAGDRRG